MANSWPWKLVVVFLILLALTPILGYVAAQNHDSGFWEVRFVEVVELVLTIALAIFATYFITAKLAQQDARRHLVVSIFDQVIENLARVNDAGSAYMDAEPGERKAAEERRIVNSLQQVSLSLSLLRDVYQQRDYPASWDEKIGPAFLRYKSLLTDSPFGTKEDYDSRTRTSINSAYFDLAGLVHRVKLRSYV